MDELQGLKFEKQNHSPTTWFSSRGQCGEVNARPLKTLKKTQPPRHTLLLHVCVSADV